MKTLISLCLLLLAPTLYAGQINKCVNAKGDVSYMDEPCPPHTRNTPIESAPRQNVSGTSQEPQTQAPSPILPPPQKSLPPAQAPLPANRGDAPPI